MGTLIDLVGKKFGKLMVIERRGTDKHKKNPLWLCECECGNQIVLPGSSLRTGNTKTCGCSKGYKSNSNRWLGCGELSKTFWEDIKRSAIKRDIDFDISIDFGWHLFVKQKRKCALTGQLLEFASSCITRGTASLDRIDSSKGYTKNNVQWVHKDVNLMKRNLDNEHFIEVCRKVIEYQEKQN